MDDWKVAFDRIRAEDALKDSVKAALTETVIRKRRAVHRLVPALLCLCLVLGSIWLYETPTTLVSVEINPLVHLSVNRFGRVIRAEGGNRDGETLLEDLRLRHLSGTQAVERILQQPLVTELMAEGEILSVGVIGEGGEQTQKLLSEMEVCVCTAGESECYYATPQELQQAQDMGLSCGKYRKLKRLQELNGDVTADEAQDMTMQQLRRHIAELESAEEQIRSHGQGHGAGMGAGNGHRHGYGKE